MAKRELSSTLRNLKFMQRAVQREEKVKKEEEPKPDGNFFASSAVAKSRCVVIMEGDPHPGAVRGRMSFQSFNPSLDKMNEETTGVRQPEAPATSSAAQVERENGSSLGGAESSDSDKYEANGDHKRKQAEVGNEGQYPNESPRNGLTDIHSGPSSSSKRKSHKQPKHEKLDWKVLRPPKGQQRKE